MRLKCFNMTEVIIIKQVVMLIFSLPAKSDGIGREVLLRHRPCEVRIIPNYNNGCYNYSNESISASQGISASQ